MIRREQEEEGGQQEEERQENHHHRLPYDEQDEQEVEDLKIVVVRVEERYEFRIQNNNNSLVSKKK